MKLHDIDIAKVQHMYSKCTYLQEAAEAAESNMHKLLQERDDIYETMFAYISKYNIGYTKTGLYVHVSNSSERDFPTGDQEFVLKRWGDSITWYSPNYEIPLDLHEYVGLPVHYSHVEGETPYERFK